MKKEAILFGASTLGEKALSLIQKDYDILFFSDNDPGKWGKKLMESK